MNVFDRWYRPTDKDLVAGPRQTQYWENFFQGSAAVANATFNTRVVPPDTVRMITTIFWFVTPGAAQFADYWQAAFNFGPVVSPINKFSVGNSFRQRIAAVTTMDYAELDGIALFPGDFIQLNANCNAGVANNTFGCSISGWEIPRANLN